MSSRKNSARISVSAACWWSIGCRRMVPWDDLLALVFDGGELSDGQAAGLTLVDDEFSAFGFCTPEDARQRLRPYVWRRVAVALDALRTGRVHDLDDGHSR